MAVLVVIETGLLVLPQDHNYQKCRRFSGSRGIDKNQPCDCLSPQLLSACGQGRGLQDETFTQFLKLFQHINYRQQLNEEQRTSLAVESATKNYFWNTKQQVSQSDRIDCVCSGVYHKELAS